MNRIRFIQVTATCLSLGVLCAFTKPAACARTAPPVFPLVLLAPIEIEALPYENTPTRPDAKEFTSKLSGEATRIAARGLTRYRIAEKVETGVKVEKGVKSEASGTPSHPLGVRLNGSIQIPISLPDEVKGWNGYQHKGTLAVGKIALIGSDGKVIAQEQVEVPWKDGRWLTGGRNKRSAPLDDVLEDITRKSIDRAVERLSKRPELRQQ